MSIITQYEPGEGPEYKVYTNGVTVVRRVDRIVTGFSGSQCRIFQPVGTPKPREECEPFSFTLVTDGRWGGPDVKGQKRFVKNLTKLQAQQAREVAKRAKLAAKIAA